MLSCIVGRSSWIGTFGVCREKAIKEESETMTEHLHLIREKKPEEKPEYKFVKVWCPHCDMWIWVIHLDLAPENPKEAKP